MAEYQNRLTHFFTNANSDDAGVVTEFSNLMLITAEAVDESFEESAEKTAGLRKLLEARDCFLRALREQYNA